MSNYVKALLSTDVAAYKDLDLEDSGANANGQQQQEEAQKGGGEHSVCVGGSNNKWILQRWQSNDSVTLSKHFALLDALFWTGLLLWSWPLSLPFWPFLAAVFLSALYAFGHEQPALLRPLLMLIICMLTIVPCLLFALLYIALRQPVMAERVLQQTLLPLSFGIASTWQMLVLVSLGLLLAIPFLYWQLQTIWLCQSELERRRDVGSNCNGKYAELNVTEPFLQCRVPPSSPVGNPLIMKESNSKLTLLNVLPDYKVFTLVQQHDGDGDSDENNGRK